MFQTFGMLRRSGMAAKAITGATTRTSKFGFEKGYSTDSEDPQLKELLDYLESLKNYEKLGVPKGAGTDSDDGFDLGRMKRLLQRLGNPQNKYQAVHIAGTKGKGSTAAFISNILRAEGYSVGCYTSLLRKIVQVWHGGLGRGKPLAIHGLHDAFNPHLMSIRERFSFGRKGEPASAESLGDLFRHVRNILDQSIELENGSLTHFEILTALGFTLFGQENVDIAVVETGLGGARDATNVLCSKGLAASVITTIGEEHLAALGGSIESIAIAKSGIIKHGRPLVMGGPFEPHIEQIIRQKAASMSSPVVSASDPAVQSVVKALHRKTDKPYQSCDLLIQVEKDMQLFIELFDVRLHMLGRHQLQNAVTATCTALCLRNQGWKISDESVRIGLEHTYLPGRCQFLTQEEAEMVGLSEASVLIDGAHTEAAAKELADTIRMTCDEPLALVVAMASDKDHFSFARQLLSGTQVKVVVLTEVSIAGGKSRMTPASLLKDAWIRAALGLGIEFLELGMGNNEKFLDCESALLAGAQKQKPILITAHETKSVKDSMNAAYSLLRARTEEQYGLVVVTGSLHIVSLVLASLHR